MLVDIHWSGFQLSVESNVAFSYVIALLGSNWLKITRLFLKQSDVKPKPIVTCSHAFLRV